MWELRESFHLGSQLQEKVVLTMIILKMLEEKYKSKLNASIKRKWSVKPCNLE